MAGSAQCQVDSAPGHRAGRYIGRVRIDLPPSNPKSPQTPTPSSAGSTPPAGTAAACNDTTRPEAQRCYVTGCAELDRRRRQPTVPIATPTRSALAAQSSSARSGCKRCAGGGGGRLHNTPGGHRSETGTEVIRHAITPATKNATAATSATTDASLAGRATPTGYQPPTRVPWLGQAGGHSSRSGFAARLFWVCGGTAEVWWHGWARARSCVCVTPSDAARWARRVTWC